MVDSIKDFILTYPDISELHIDYVDDKAHNFAIMPNGQTVISQFKDILGNVIKEKQYNVVLYVVDMAFDDVVRLDNSNWLDNFTKWVEENPNRPILGDYPEEETWAIQNGMLFERHESGDFGTYQLQIGITYKIKEEN